MRALMFTALLLLAACSKVGEGEITTLVYASPYAPSHPFSRADQIWMAHVEAASGGSLRIRPVWSGALLSSEHSMTELRHGLADIGLITPIYTKGGTHLIRIQSGFYSGITTMSGQLALYRCLQQASPQFDTEMQGLRVLAVQGGSLPGIITVSRQVNTLNDLRGLRLRAPAELLGVLEDLGADPVNMPMGDVYSALAKGVIDGVVAPLDTFRALHFGEVADFYAQLLIPRGAYPARAINLDSWSGLTTAQQEVLEQSIGIWESALAEQVEVATVQGREQALADGVVFTGISATDQQLFDELYMQEAAANAASASARYGIDAMTVFNVARASVVPDSGVRCMEGVF